MTVETAGAFAAALAVSCALFAPFARGRSSLSLRIAHPDLRDLDDANWRLPVWQWEVLRAGCILAGAMLCVAAPLPLIGVLPACALGPSVLVRSRAGVARRRARLALTRLLRATEAALRSGASRSSGRSGHLTLAPRSIRRSGRRHRALRPTLGRGWRSRRLPSGSPRGSRTIEPESWSPRWPTVWRSRSASRRKFVRVPEGSARKSSCSRSSCPRSRRISPSPFRRSRRYSDSRSDGSSSSPRRRFWSLPV